MYTLKDLAGHWGISPSAARRKLMRITDKPLILLGFKIGNTWVFPIDRLAYFGIVIPERVLS